MLLEHKKTLLVLLAGLGLGGAAGYGVKASRVAAVDVMVAEFDSIIEADAVDAGVALARQLPLADSEKCAALAKAMLAKRVKVSIPTDPFSNEPTEEIREEYLPERTWEGLFRRWMMVAPQAAWAFVLEHHSDALPLREAALRQWALIDPAAAVTAAGSDTTDDEKRVILKACVESNPAMGLKFLAEWGMKFDTDEASDPFGPDSSLAEKMLIRLAERSPAAAMEWCLAHVPREMDAVCVGWMRHDVTACMEWMRARPVDEQKNLMSTICEQADVTASSVRYLATLCEPGEHWQWIDEGLLSLARRDEVLAQTLIDELLTNPTDRLVARSEIANVLAESDPRKGLELILPALQQALPLFESQSDIFINNSLPSSIGISDDPFESSYSGLTSVIRAYIELGPAAGVGKTEVLALMGQIHPQYHACLMENIFMELRRTLGPSVDWMDPYTTQMSREQIVELVDNFSYSTADGARQHALSLKPGPLRDAFAERYLAIQLENNVPVASVLESAKELGGDRLDYSYVYEYWIKEQPSAVLQHIAQNPQSSVSEWESVIAAGYKDYGAEIQDTVAALPAGDLRNAAALALTEKATQNSDFVTSIYWATEITTRLERAKQMRSVMQAWQTNDNAIHDASILEGMRSNIESSYLDAQEKALWLERIESEVQR